MLRACSSLRVLGSRSFSAITRYAASHEWVKVEGKTATVGITSHASELLGDIVHVDFPSVGASFEAGESFGAVESVKAASDIYAPISGEVVEVNKTMDPRSSSFKATDWMVKFSIKDAKQLDALMDEAAYKTHCDNEAH